MSPLKITWVSCLIVFAFASGLLIYWDAGKLILSIIAIIWAAALTLGAITLNRDLKASK